MLPRSYSIRCFAAVSVPRTCALTVVSHALSTLTTGTVRFQDLQPQAPNLSHCPMHLPQALYASKICSYAQGMNIIKAKSDEKKWGVNMGGLARIWKVGASAAGRALESCSKA